MWSGGTGGEEEGNQQVGVGLGSWAEHGPRGRMGLDLGLAGKWPRTLSESSKVPELQFVRPLNLYIDRSDG